MDPENPILSRLVEQTVRANRREKLPPLAQLSIIAENAEKLSVPIELLTEKTMSKKEIAAGVVHSVPEDLRKVLIADRVALSHWEDITPLARNEWICWVEDAKKLETRRSRIERVRTELKEGMRRPCCWGGCPHRDKESKRKQA